MNPLVELNQLGQSIWYDNITRSMLGDDLQALIDNDDLRGITSNPSIFQKAITSSDTYDSAIQTIIQNNPSVTAKEVFFELAIDDIRAAADQLLGQYEKTNGTDGFVSLEVSPDLAHDTDGTIKEARELHQRLARPNVMIKVPATEAGIDAIETLIADGISINVTLLFSVDRYKAVAEAYIRGLETRDKKNVDSSNIRSVASFFVSRVDAAVDPLLEAHESTKDLQGAIAIANAKAAYQAYKTYFESESFLKLKAAPQRLLWASTSTKNPEYSDVLYIDSLIAPNTVNTVPPATYDAFRDHGTVALTLPENLDVANQQLSALDQAGIDLTAVTDQLEAEGVASFKKAFDSLLADLQTEIDRLT